jgi:Protein of unknown function (DUF3489)
MPKLTDTQLIILAAAAKREDRCILPLPRKVKLEAEAAAAIFKTLIKRKLVTARPAKGSEAGWRESPGADRIALVITETGLQAIGAAPQEDLPAGRSKPEGTAKRSRSPSRPASTRSAPGKPSRPPRVHGRSSANSPRSGRKQEQMIGLLHRPEGASIAEMAKASGWQVHSLRGVMSGTLKKKLGLAIASEKVEGRGRIYRIADHG